jgi:hypothetical protein
VVRPSKDEFKVDRCQVKGSRLVDWVNSKSKVGVVRHGKDIDNKLKRSTEMRSTGGPMEN